jgi:hypothetical protein
MEDDRLSGKVKHRHIQLTKSRDHSTDWQCEFTLEPVLVGYRKDDTEVYSACVQPIDGGGVRIAQIKKGGRPSGDGKAYKALINAFNEVPAETVRVQGDGPEVRAVRRHLVLVEFEKRYIVDGDDPKKVRRRY